MYYLPKFGKIVWNDANAVTQKLKYADVKVVKAEKEYLQVMCCIEQLKPHSIPILSAVGDYYFARLK